MSLFRLKIPQYTSSDFTILLLTIFPLTFLFNSFLFGKRYFTDWEVLFIATSVTFIILSIGFLFYGTIAIALKNSFPNDKDTGIRLAITIAIFLLMSAVIVSIIFRGYERIGFFNYRYKDNDFLKAFICLGITNIFLTFFHEGLSRFENYRNTVTETEQLKGEYMRSQLLGLKSQINPHFLFNSLNVLSCLIQDDSEKAEKFLNELSKVYRYLLRSNNDQLVSLNTELNFINSYYYLLNERYGDGLSLEINIPEQYKELMIPPLTLQMILENVFTHNVICKEFPLSVKINGEAGAWLSVYNNIQRKVNSEENWTVVALENIVNKFKLLCQQDVSITETKSDRLIRLPLIEKKELSVA